MQRLNPVLTSLTAALLSTALLQRDHTPAAQSPHDPFHGLEPAAMGEALMTAAVAAAPSDDQPGHAAMPGAPFGLLQAAAARCGLATGIATSLQQVCVLSCRQPELLSPAGEHCRQGHTEASNGVRPFRLCLWCSRICHDCNWLQVCMVHLMIACAASSYRNAGAFAIL